MNTCAICGQPIEAGPGPARPWLHTNGAAYEDDGVSEHHAIPRPPHTAGGR